MTKRTNTRGTAPLLSSPRKVQGIPRFLRGRVCAEEGCSTLLSAYNGAVYCWVHEAPRKFRPRPTSKGVTAHHMVRAPLTPPGTA
jgi:hypothetical protein